jgi:protein phosphatase
MLDDPTLARILGAATDPREAAEEVVAAAVRAGGRDNATAIVVDVVGLVDGVSGGVA